MSHQFYHTKKLMLSNSSVNLFRSCQRKFEFHKMYEVGGRESTVDTAVGTAMHNAFQDFLHNNDEDKAIGRLLLDYPIQFEVSDYHSKSLYSCYATLMAMMARVSMQTYELAYIKDKNGIEKPAIELSFELVLKDVFLDKEKTIPVTYRGKLDAIFFDAETETYTVIDIKTTGRKSTALHAKYMFDEQAIPYGIVLEHILGHSVDRFKVIYLNCVMDIADPEITEEEYFKDGTDVADWIKGLLQDIEIMSKNYDNLWWRREASSCVSYNRPCFFIDYCSTREPATINQMLIDPEHVIKHYEDRFGEPFVTFELEIL